MRFRRESEPVWLRAEASFAAAVPAAIFPAGFRVPAFWEARLRVDERGKGLYKNGFGAFSERAEPFYFPRCVLRRNICRT